MVKRSKRDKENDGPKWFESPYKGYIASFSLRQARARRAAEAGFDERELEIILNCEAFFNTPKWKKVLKSREEATIERATRDGHSIPDKDDWKLFRAGKRNAWARNKEGEFIYDKKGEKIRVIDTSAYEVVVAEIESWMKAAHKVAVETGSTSIGDIFKDWGES